MYTMQCNMFINCIHYFVIFQLISYSRQYSKRKLWALVSIYKSGDTKCSWKVTQLMTVQGQSSVLRHLEEHSSSIWWGGYLRYTDEGSSPLPHLHGGDNFQRDRALYMPHHIQRGRSVNEPRGYASFPCCHSQTRCSCEVTHRVSEQLELSLALW